MASIITTRTAAANNASIVIRIKSRVLGNLG